MPIIVIDLRSKRGIYADKVPILENTECTNSAYEEEPPSLEISKYQIYPVLSSYPNHRLICKYDKLLSYKSITNPLTNLSLTIDLRVCDHHNFIHRQ